MSQVPQGAAVGAGQRRDRQLAQVGGATQEREVGAAGEGGERSFVAGQGKGDRAALRARVRREAGGGGFADEAAAGGLGSDEPLFFELSHGGEHRVAMHAEALRQASRSRESGARRQDAPADVVGEGVDDAQEHGASRAIVAEVEVVSPSAGAFALRRFSRPSQTGLSIISNLDLCHHPVSVHGRSVDSRPVTDRTRLRRHPERGLYDRTALHALLDAATVAYVGTPDPRVVPMAFGRVGHRIYLHGARKHGTLRAGTPVCVTVSRLDALVVARSAFHHSVNFASAMIFGELREVDEVEARAGLDALIDQLLPGRSSECRPPSAAEFDATTVLALDLDEAAVKIRRGPPKEARVDDEAPGWHGLLELETRARAPVWADEHGRQVDDPVPESVRRAALRMAPRLEGAQMHGEYRIESDPLRVDRPRLLRWLRDEAYWAPDIDDDRLLASLLSSHFVAAYGGADEGEAMVGFARAVTDGCTFAWLCDVFVDADHRGRGLARAMTQRLIDHPRHMGIRRWLLATRDAHGVYAPLGFETVPEGRFMQRLKQSLP